MDIDRHRRIKTIAEAALELPEGERTAHVAAAVGADATLGADVLRLLEATRVAEAGEFLATHAGAVPAELGGEHRYRILHEIGRGGMGAVYLGERADGEFRQRVAIKLLHVETGNQAELQRRFRAERQILADLQHPNIARLIDGGTLADGRPFLVMEHVDGQRLDQWCDLQHLDRDARVRLFLKVCAAVSHAHQHLVVHRDLKPGNILVDRSGEPKLLDFGIAKLLAADASQQTATRDRLLTIAYASPEQVRGAGIGTASDVYSLAVVLYRLLTGRLPYRAPEDSAAALARAICDDAPTPASARARDGDAAPTLVRQRLDRDLDHILLKALRKEPEQRYRSVEQLGDDLQRYLDGLPVLARRGSRLYTLSKFLHRHALAAAAAGVVLALIVGFAVDRQRQLAATELERDRAQRLVQFMTGLFENADPEKSGGKKVVVADVLDVAARSIEAERGQQPLDRAAMLQALGEVYRTLGDFARAAQLLGAARDLRHGAGSLLERAASDLALGGVRQQQRQLDQAEQHLRAALTTFQAQLGEAHWRTAEARGRLAMLARDRSEFERAQRELELALATMLRGLGLREPPSRLDPSLPRDALLALAATLSNLGTVAHDRKDWTTARGRLNQALALRRLLHGENDPLLTQTLGTLASIARENGELDEATRLREQILALREQAYGPEHWQVGAAWVNLGDSYGSLARYDEARTAAENAERIFTRTLGPNHPYTLIALGNQATAAADEPSQLRALALAEEVLRRRRAVLPPDHPDVALSLYQVATKLAKLGRPAESLAQYDAAFAIYAKHYGAEHPYLDENRISEADVLVQLGRNDEARTRLRRVVAHDGATDASVPVVALAKFRLAQLLDSDAATKAEALGLAQAAAEVARREGRSDTLDPAEIDAWLAARKAELRASAR